MNLPLKLFLPSLAGLLLLAAVLVGVQEAPIAAGSHPRIVALLYGLFLIILLLGIALEFLLRRPVMQLARGARDLDRGNLQAPLPKARCAEVGSLVAGLSAASDRLRSCQTELQNEIERRQQDKQALHESEERYALAVRGANDGLWEWNLKTDEAYFSPRWKCILGFCEQEIGNRIEEWRGRIHPDDKKQTLDDLKAHLDGLTSHFESEHRLLHKDGRYRWILARGIALRTAGGKPYRMVALTTDIGERKRVEEILWRLVEATSPVTGEAFFQALVRNFACVLGVRYAFITECVDYPTTKVRTLAFWAGDGFRDNLEFALAGTPCEKVVGDGKVCLFSSNVRAIFPKDQLLAAMGAESYVGVPILDSTGKVIGHLAFLDEKPMGEEILVKSIFKIFAARAAAELERQRADRLAGAA